MPLLALRCTPPASSCIARLQRSALLGLDHHPRATVVLFVFRRRRCRPARAHSDSHCSRPVRAGVLEYTEPSSHTYRSPVPPPHSPRLFARYFPASAHACFLEAESSPRARQGR